MAHLRLWTDCSRSGKSGKLEREEAEDGSRSVHERVEGAEVRKEEESEKIRHYITEDWDNGPI